MIQEADYNMTEQAMGGANAQGRKPDALLAKFYTKAVQDKAASVEAGRPIYKEKHYVRIFTPGNKTSVIDRAATDRDKREFAVQYEAFLRSEDSEVLEGTPLSEWPQVNRAQVEELAYFNVKTVEHLAHMADNVAQKFMGAITLRQRAKDYLAKAENSAPIVALREENETLRQELAAMKDQINELAGSQGAGEPVEAPAAPARRRRTSKG